ncbi:hypothetical protein [Methanoculleus chikugoensis]|uniref:hypothetical protein n=1 Tax=Methanoculleus chikugoensis TaxID=118126 RepID=UPI0006D03888|nr:hypothetical protein [Methanoculleus chikugoensis]
MADIAKFDGYAVKSGETRGAQDQRPLPLAGYARVNTGEVLPRPFDAVVMIEDTWDEGGIPRIRKSAAPGQNIRRTGEDVRAGGNSSSRRATGSGRSISVRSRPTG